MRLLYHEVATLQPVLVGIAGKQLYRVKLLEVALHVVERGVFLELLAVVVGIFECKLDDESAHGGLLVVGGDVGGVLGYKDVGRDTAAAIYGAAQDGLIGRPLVLDAVLREEFTMLIACDKVVFVVFVVASGIVLLDAASRG